MWSQSQEGPGAMSSGILALNRSSSWAHPNGAYASLGGCLLPLYLKGDKTLAFKSSMNDCAVLSELDEDPSSLLHGLKESTLCPERTLKP